MTESPEGVRDSDRRETVRCRLAVMGAGLLWSLGGLFIKGLSGPAGGSVSALGIVCYRSLFAALCLAPFLAQRAPGRKHPRAADVAVAVVVYTLLLGLYVAATQGTSAANAILLQYTAPLYALVLGPLFFREPLVRADAAALAVALMGIGVLLAGNFSPRESTALLQGVGSGVAFGVFLLWLRRLRYADPFTVTAWNNAGVALLAAAALAATRPAELALMPRLVAGDGAAAGILGTLALMGAVQIAAPYVLFSYGLRRLPAVEGSLISLVEPLLNPVWVLLFIGERPSPATLAGGALIVAALAARYTLFRERTPASANE